ncbi:MAG: D-alanyl-D-alanine carboxypeptidase [Thiotrichales bacterium]|nr:MAG: D-alanyl-D-alanine carboxypeptidase [Thiotrichales bacterium]
MFNKKLIVICLSVLGGFSFAYSTTTTPPTKTVDKVVIKKTDKVATQHIQKHVDTKKIAKPLEKRDVNKLPLNKYGAIDINANVPIAVQVPVNNHPGKLAKITPLTTTWKNFVPAQPRLNAKSYILMAANTGQIILAHNANKRIMPASLTKLMLLYIVSGQLESGSLHLNDEVTVPVEAWATGGSRMFLKSHSKVTLKNLISGMIVDSGNDAAVATATYIAGTQNAFVSIMNYKAHRLGMNNTHFSDVMGLPAPNHYSSARDLAVLSSALVSDYPQYIPWYSQKWFVYSGITQANYNKLIFMYKYAKGLKTGSTSQSGYSLAAFAEQPDNSLQLISIVIGARSRVTSATDSKSLLSYGFRFFQSKLLYRKDVSVKSIRVYFGKDKTIQVAPIKDVYAVYPKSMQAKMTAKLIVNKNIHSPVQKGQVVGKIVVKLNDKVINTVPVQSCVNNAKGNWWRRFVDRIVIIF